MAVDGTTTAEYVAKEAVEGSDVVLTIDANLQKVTEDALAANIQKISSGGFGQSFDAKSGACVVMNVNSGEILAMASYPTYNPADFVGGISTENWNNYNNDEAHPLVNKAVQSSYSPGSTFKMVTAIAGLESGAIDLKTKINDTGIYTKYRDFQPRCWYYNDYHRGHGWLDVSGAIEKSCNYFFYETADRMGIDTLAKFAKYFGLGTKTGVELPSETSGYVACPETKAKLHPNDSTWYAADTLQSAIGQNDNSFSPVQMARYISMLANGGNRIQPTIVRTIRNSDGSEVSKEDIESFVNKKLGIEEEQVEDININQEYLNAVLAGMESVTQDSSGTAYVRFKDFGISVGGKTGSAETTGGVNAWFVGFAPFENPEIAIVVIVENGGHGNYTAEVVRDIMEEYFGMNVQTVEEDMTAEPYVQIMN